MNPIPLILVIIGIMFYRANAQGERAFNQPNQKSVIQQRGGDVDNSFRSLLFSSKKNPDGEFLIKNFSERQSSSDSGALSVNVDYHKGDADMFYIEQQRYGADIIETGILLERKDLIKEGIKVLNWGVSQQALNGGFPKCGDVIHSSSLFLEALSRAGIALKEYSAEEYLDTIVKWESSSMRLARWFIHSDHRGKDVNLEPFSHRYFLRGAALSQTAYLTGQKELYSYADRYIQDGLSKQEESGAFLEKGGYDMSYHMVGVTFAARYCATSINKKLRDMTTMALWNGINHFLQGVNDDGSLALDPKSRTATETGRSGSKKTLDYKHMVKGLVFAEEGLFMAQAKNTAHLILASANKL